MARMFPDADSFEIISCRWWYELPPPLPEANLETNAPLRDLMVPGASIIIELEMDQTAARKILIVDDDELTHLLLRHHLERAGFISLHATCGRAALDLAFDEQPHVVVMDVMMEDMDGISVLKELRKNPKTRNTPVIMITATTLEIARHESKLLGAMQYLTKPFSPAQLLDAISKVLSSPAAAASGQAS